MKTYPDNDVISFFYAKLCLRLEMLDEALEELDLISLKRKDFPALHRLLAEIYLHKKDFSRAAQEFEKTFELSGTSYFPFVCTSVPTGIERMGCLLSPMSSLEHLYDSGGRRAASPFSFAEASPFSVERNVPYFLRLSSSFFCLPSVIAVRPFLPEGQQGLCPGCLSAIHWIEPPFCTRCGIPFPSREEKAIPAAFVWRKRYFTMGRALGYYEGPFREAIHRWKYQGKIYITLSSASGWQNAFLTIGGPTFLISSFPFPSIPSA